MLRPWSCRLMMSTVALRISGRDRGSEVSANWPTELLVSSSETGELARYCTAWWKIVEIRLDKLLLTMRTKHAIGNGLNN